MSDKIGPRCANGEVEGTGAKISIVCGFRPAAVMLYNVDGEVELAWNRSMAADSGYKKLGISSGANANESSHTHAVALDSGSSEAVSAGTPAGSIVVTGVNASAGTPAGTNAASAVSAKYLPDFSAIVKPAIKLTYAADPAGAGDGPLFIEEGLSGASSNCGKLSSVTAASADVLGETADGSVFGAAGSARFWVSHSAAPAGVQIYVNETASYQLECISPTEQDVVICMPMENAAGVGSAYVNVVVHHSATADSGKPLYFEDGAAADAQLVFVATDMADHAIPPSDITVAFSGVGVGSAGGFGSAAGQVFTGAAMGDHLHADTAVFTGSALATHIHGPGTLADAASGAGSAHTHVFSGGASEAEFITSGGISSRWDGFDIGTDSDVNVAAETLYWVAWRF